MPQSKNQLKPSVRGSRKANDRQVGGEHYKVQGIEPWDYVAANNLGYFEGSIIKYITRWRLKGGTADLEKAAHYLEKLMELEVLKNDRRLFHGTSKRR